MARVKGWGKRKSTEIVVVVDKSGSMDHLTKDTIGSFNSFLAKQKELPGEASMTLILFDTAYNALYKGADIKDVKPLDERSYIASGGTALLDALGRTINDVKGRTCEKCGGNVMFVIITDGEENSSHTFNRGQIFNMISEMKEKGWQFIFLGANQDSIQEAGSIGIMPSMVMNYYATSDGLKHAYSGINCATTSYRMCGQISSDWNTGGDIQP